MSSKASLGSAAELADLTACDREPIHIPGSIQPHGLLLVADAATLQVVGGAGDLEGRLARDWLGLPLAELIGIGIENAVGAADPGPGATIPLGTVRGTGESFDAALHRVGAQLIVELEPVAEDGDSRATLAWLDATASQMDRTPHLIALCERAAVAFRELTGFDRVMIYRFLDDDAGTVVAESRDPALATFLNHHFPASDIPKQARQLYVRNRIRVIPDVHYVPAPLRPAPAGLATLDLSDVTLRSVSPIHIEYLKNMGIAASASVSIVKDGVLWGLIACHSATPRLIPFDRRAAAKALAGGLARQIKAKEDAERYRERLRLRGSEDSVMAQLGSALDFRGAREPLRELLSGDGFALIGAEGIHASGATPDEAALRAIAAWLRENPADGDVFATGQLAADFPAAAAFQATASGMLAFALPGDGGTVLAWFRAEQVEQVNWAGNPHKAVEHRPGEQLTPRASFESWSQTVRGRARPWSIEEVEAARRLRRALFDARQNRRLRELNRELAATIADKEALLLQNEYLIKEVNHRVQNSLQLVASFLGLQAKALDDPTLKGHFAEAQSRLAAVAQVHRRLHQDDRVETVDLARYIEQLCADIAATMGGAANAAITLDLTPVLVSPDRAVNLGLVLTELVINANKYAYRGGSGPIEVSLEQHRNRLQLSVADRGVGKHEPGSGFGTRMMTAMVERIDGTIAYEDNQPGLRAVVTAPIG